MSKKMVEETEDVGEDEFEEEEEEEILGDDI